MEKTLDERISALFDEYDARKKAIEEQYNYIWDNAFTASEILAVNEWHGAEQEKLGQWWRKELRQLSEQMG